MNGVVSPSPLEPEEENASLPETSLLDKSKFDVRLELLAIQVPRELCSAITRILNGYLLNRPRVKPVVQASADEKLRCILLSEDIKDPDLSEIPSTKRDAVRNLCAINVVPYPLVLGYTYWSVEHILKQILPPGVEVPSSFETIGHIAHLNLCDGLLAYKHLIAQVILEKNQPKIKTVVNKVGTITNEFRVPTFEVLAGEDNLVTEVKQYGATFRLDYGLVYWNSRLEHEHKRLTTLFQPEQLICDMFAGVGPFAIPAAQKGCVVYANDLNASSVRYLSINSEINRVKKNIHIYNMDARDFISNLLSKGGIHVCSTQLDEHQRSKSLDSEESNCQSPDVSSSTSLISTDIEDKLSKRWKEKEKKQKITNIDDSRTPLEHIDHIIMNLPASALEFLDIFRNPFSRKDWKGSMPWIHCYCFMRSTENEDTVIQHAQEILGAKIEGQVVHKVRDVAPNKEMLCLSFKLPESAAFKDDLASPSSYQDDDTSTADMKRQRTEIDTTSIPHA